MSTLLEEMQHSHVLQISLSFQQICCTIFKLWDPHLLLSYKFPLVQSMTAFMGTSIRVDPFHLMAPRNKQ